MSDSILRSIQIEAPLDKVWDALTDYRQFGEWFRVDLKSPFVAGQPTTGTIMFRERPMDFEFLVEAIRPKTYFSYRWHPYAVDPKADYSKETPTLVEFRLEELGELTRVTVNESGFEALTSPPEERMTTLEGNTRGWASVMEQLAGVFD